MRKWIVIGVLIWLPALPAEAGPRQDVRAGSARCDAINDDRVWLDCYYGAAQPMRAQLGLPPAPASQTHLIEQQAAASERGAVAAAPQSAPNVNSPPPLPKKSGFLGNIFHDAPDPHVSRVRMTSYTFDGAHHFTVTLANGEVWAQQPDDFHVARWRSSAENYVVTISPGFLGNYNMHIADMDGDFKVRRVP